MRAIFRAASVYGVPPCSRSRPWSRVSHRPPRIQPGQAQLGADPRELDADLAHLVSPPAVPVGDVARFDGAEVGAAPTEKDRL